MKLNLQSLS